LLICWPGVIVGIVLAPANVSDTAVVPELVDGMHGWLLGDRSYWNPQLKAIWTAQQLGLPSPLQFVNLITL